MSVTESHRSANNLHRCEQQLGYQFKDSDYLLSALTHSSSANTRQSSNERLEFLGDSVLGLVTCEQLFLRFPEYQEGDLTKIKSVIVSRKTCAQFSRELNLGDYLILGKGVAQTEIPSNLLANGFEAVVAAIFLDGGWEAARVFVRRFIDPEMNRVAEQAIVNNAKSQLQQVAQRDYGDTPRYVVLDEQGPDHDKCFKVSAEIAGTRFVPVWGRNKKEAELKAAMNALAALRGESVPYVSD